MDFLPFSAHTLEIEGSSIHSALVCLHESVPAGARCVTVHVRGFLILMQGEKPGERPSDWVSGDGIRLPKNFPGVKKAKKEK